MRGGSLSFEKFLPPLTGLRRDRERFIPGLTPPGYFLTPLRG